ncbi:MAG: sugar phosphate isomerase/epimerase family protein [bacterium]|jgi:L-ribulose-5-phosphate 3-epimerase
MNISRRGLLSGAAAGALALGMPSARAQEPKSRKSTINLAISSYSYWHFAETKYPIEKVIDKASELGVSGVDVLHRQMESEERSYMNKLKRHAFVNGIDLIALSIHQDFVSPDAAEQKKNIEHTIHCIELAHAMGIPCIRLNSGRWGTIRSFDDLMAARGIEPPIEGYTEDDAFRWCIEGIEAVLPKAEEMGVILALENHWGLSRTPEGMLRIAKAFDSPFFGLMLDTGNFMEDPYDKLEQIAPHAVFIQAKTYYGGGEWYSLELDYKRIASILYNAGFNGYVSLEFEGKAPADEGVPQSIAMLKEAFDLG